MAAASLPVAAQNVSEPSSVSVDVRNSAVDTEELTAGSQGAPVTAALR